MTHTTDEQREQIDTPELDLVPIWSGKLKTRLSLKEFRELVSKVLGHVDIREIHKQLQQMGLTSKVNSKYLQNLLEQNAYHQDRVAHLIVLGRNWLRWAVREQPEKDVVLQIIPYLNESSDVGRQPVAPAQFAAILRKTRDMLGEIRMHEFMALCADHSCWMNYKDWVVSSSHASLQQATDVTSSEAVDDAPVEQPATSLLAPVDMSGSHPSNAQERESPRVPPIIDPAQNDEVGVKQPALPEAQDDSDLWVPVLSTTDMLPSLRQQLAQVLVVADSVLQPMPALDTQTTEEMEAIAQALRNLSEMMSQLSKSNGLARATFSSDLLKAVGWLESHGRTLGLNTEELELQARSPVGLSNAHDRFAREYELLVQGLRQEHAELRIRLANLEHEWSALPELPELQARAWQEQSRNIISRLDSTGADALAGEIQRFLDRLRLEQRQKELRIRLEGVEKRIHRIPDAQKRARCQARLQSLIDDGSMPESQRTMRIEELEDMLPIEREGDKPDSPEGITHRSSSVRSAENALENGLNQKHHLASQRIERVQVQHSFFSDARTGGQKRPVLIIPPEPKPLVVPIALELESPLKSAASLEITLSGEGPLFKSFSIERRSCTRTIEFPPNVNRLEITLPLPLPSSVRSRLSERKSPLQVRITTLGQSTDFQWDSLLLRPSIGELPRNPLAIASPSHDDIQRLQVGIETRLESIMEWIRTGRGHIYITAPRRFGKTSVIDYCHQSFLQDKDVALVRVECKPSHYGKRGQVFKLVVRALAQKLEVNEGPTCDRLDRWQDSEDDWDHLETVLFQKLRHDAIQKRFQRIVVLIDEAQILFARGFIGNAYEFADRMKSFMEGIARIQTGANHAPVFVGYFGRLNLPHLFGQNLRDTFLPPTARVTALSEDEVTAVLRCINAEVDSTVSARQRLREYGINLVFLRDMFGAICDQMAAEHRIYIVRSDVDQAITSMRDHRDIFQYLRDPLNRSDDTNVWQPVRGYPVAIAIAVAAKGEEFVSLRTVVEHLSKLVGGEMITEDLLKRILNDDELNDLVERSRDLVRIKAEPLRQFLRERLPSDDELRLYVAELILPDLELPPGSEKVNVGGEAELHRAVVDGAEVAIRYFLPDANPVRFQREVSALKRLGQQRKPGQPGFLSLPELVKFGRAPNGRLVAVYKWVDGVSIREQLTRCQPGGLPPHLVRTVAYQVATALSVVHGQQLAHRDIKPENILLSTQGVAVLIDFGLVRDTASLSSTNTVGTGLYIPPVGQGTPSGDLYALARTICIMMSGSDSEQGLSKGLSLVEQKFGTAASKVVQRALRPDIDDRGTAQEFAEVFAPVEKKESEFSSERESIGVLFVGRGLNERVRNSLTVATSFADGVVEANLRLVVGATLCCDLIDCLQRERGTHVRAIDSLLNAPDELVSLGLSSAQDSVRLARATNQLRNGFGHWNNLDNQISTATKTVSGKRDHLVPAVQKTLQAVATALYRGSNEQDKQRRESIQQVAARILLRDSDKSRQIV